MFGDRIDRSLLFRRPLKTLSRIGDQQGPCESQLGPSWGYLGFRGSPVERVLIYPTAVGGLTWGRLRTSGRFDIVYKLKSHPSVASLRLQCLSAAVAARG